MSPGETARALRREARKWLTEATRLRYLAAAYENAARVLERAAQDTEDVERRRAAGELEEGDR